MSEPTTPKCAQCGENQWNHLHSEAHGIPGTHMAGSEHFKCVCGYMVLCNNPEAKLFPFILDKP